MPSFTCKCLSQMYKKQTLVLRVCVYIMQQCSDNGCKMEQVSGPCVQVITPNAERVISSRDDNRNDAADTYETGIMHKHAQEREGERGMLVARPGVR